VTVVGERRGPVGGRECEKKGKKEGKCWKEHHPQRGCRLKK